jgi:hypothetical protein
MLKTSTLKTINHRYNKLVEGTRIWKIFPYSTVSRINIAKMAEMSKVIYVLNGFPIKFFTEIEKKTLRRSDP